MERIVEILMEIQAREGIAVVMSEQNASLALSLANRAVIMELGRSTAEGDAGVLMDDPKVRSAYLGV